MCTNIVICTKTRSKNNFQVTIYRRFWFSLKALATKKTSGFLILCKCLHIIFLTYFIQFFQFSDSFQKMSSICFSTYFNKIIIFHEQIYGMTVLFYNYFHPTIKIQTKNATQHFQIKITICKNSDANKIIGQRHKK